MYFGLFVVWRHNVRDVLCVPLCAADCASTHATHEKHPGHFKAHLPEVFGNIACDMTKPKYSRRHYAQASKSRRRVQHIPFCF
jgi:hypothetical protein